MKCKICGSENLRCVFEGPVRDGTVGVYTKEPQRVYYCDDCGTHWHKDLHEGDSSFYESEEYRKEIEGTAEVENYYRIFDSKQYITFGFVDMGQFRNKVVADSGCAGGSFLDFVKGVAKKTVAIEPSQIYQKALREKGHAVFPYQEDALAEYRGKIDVITSFDVIEHVPDPVEFIQQQYDLLAPGGKMIIGTPTDYPNIRAVIPEEFEPFLFSVQHPWIFEERSLRYIARQAGFCEEKMKAAQKQRFGLSNLHSWALYRQPKGDKPYPFFSQALEDAYRREQEANNRGDYLLLYAEKEGV